MTVSATGAKRNPTNTGLAALDPTRSRVYRRRYQALRRDALRQPGAGALIAYIDGVLAELDGGMARP